MASSEFNCVPVDADESVISKTAKGENAFACILGVESYKDLLYESLPR